MKTNINRRQFLKSTYATGLGLIILPCGYWGNTVRLLAPLTIPPEHLEEGLDLLEQSLVETRAVKAA